MELDSLYQEVILDNYKHPYKKGLKQPFEMEVHHVNTTCGDEITLRLSLEKQVDNQEDKIYLSYAGDGCAISQASASIMAQLLENVSIPKALTLLAEFQKMISSKGNYAGSEELLADGVALASVSRYPARVKCALLAWTAFKDALSQLVEAR